MQWTEKYRPRKFEEILGQDESLSKIRQFIEKFNKISLRNSKKAIILHGPPGTGKTTIAQVVASESNAELFELNASDLRNKSKLQEILKPVLTQQSLTKKNKIILVDEADGMSGTDRGGITELLALMEFSSYPVIITANDLWLQKLSPLRKKAELVQLKEISPYIIKNVLIQILKQENKFVENQILNQLIIKAKGDLRAAINDLQAISNLEDASEFQFDERNKKTDIFHALKKIFKETPTNEMLRVFDSVDLSIDEIILWIEENIPNEYSDYALARAYNLLGKTDVFKKRIYRQQYWRFLLYENIFLSYGVSSAKKVPQTNFTSYQKPSRILKIWLNNQRSAKKKSIAIKYAAYVHVGIKRAMSEFPIIKQIINSNPQIASELKLNEEEISYLSKEN